MGLECLFCFHFVSSENSGGYAKLMVLVLGDVIRTAPIVQAGDISSSCFEHISREEFVWNSFRYDAEQSSKRRYVPTTREMIRNRLITKKTKSMLVLE